MPEVLDTNRNTFGHYDTLKAAGVKTVIRYIARGLEGEEKVIKVGEAHAIADAGLRLGLVYETDGRPSGHDNGLMAGQYALDKAKSVGAPPGAIIWGTVDWDAGAGALPGIRAWFQGFQEGLNAIYRVGAYASGMVCDDLYAKSLCVARWLTDSGGFQGTKASRAAGRYELDQALPTQIAGLDTDPDARHRAADGTEADIGDFVPFGGGVALPADPVYPQPTPVPAPTPSLPQRMIGITATEFGGAGDPQRSAYDNSPINPAEPCAALPARLPSNQRSVRIFRGDKSIVCRVADVGPHNTHDDYWNRPGARPLAESQHGNRAGIDLTKAAHDALGVPGPDGTRTAVIDWEFA